MKTVKLIRHWSDHKQSTGTLLVLDQHKQPIFSCVCIERGDMQNKRKLSRVPDGVFPLVYEYSPRFNKHLWELKEVPNRSECKIHPANFWDELHGCIAPGLSLKELNNDGYYDVIESIKATREFHKALEGITKTTIEIKNETT